VRRMVERSSDERAFTLIELLVVVVIIGILAGIAIPVFLAQRQRAYRAAAASDAKSMATSQYGYFSDDAVFSATVSGLEPIGFRRTPHVEHAVCVVDGGASFIVGARDVRTDTVFAFEGEDGQLVESELPGTDVAAAIQGMDPGCAPSAS
jgi:type IV pilus assembly protein PilA